MASAESEGAGTPAETSGPDVSSAAQGAPETASAENAGTQNAGAQTPDTDPTDRPGDIPFDQAAAEHENPALG